MMSNYSKINFTMNYYSKIHDDKVIISCTDGRTDPNCKKNFVFINEFTKPHSMLVGIYSPINALIEVCKKIKAFAPSVHQKI